MDAITKLIVSVFYLVLPVARWMRYFFQLYSSTYTQSLSSSLYIPNYPLCLYKWLGAIYTKPFCIHHICKKLYSLHLSKLHFLSCLCMETTIANPLFKPIQTVLFFSKPLYNELSWLIASSIVMAEGSSFKKSKNLNLTAEESYLLCVNLIQFEIEVSKYLTAFLNT